MKPLLSGFIQTQRFKAAAPHIRGDVLDIGCGNAGILACLDSGHEVEKVVAGAPTFAYPLVMLADLMSNPRTSQIPRLQWISNAPAEMMHPDLKFKRSGPFGGVSLRVPMDETFA